MKVAFTPEEVMSLNEYQASGMFHPFTCGTGLRMRHPDGEGVLVATEYGWICPHCGYKQDWAHEWMKDGSWRLGGCVGENSRSQIKSNNS
jgi:hypothetical protein